ncbi:MAG: sulfatase-like hydrolase/transferase [Eubacteriales bacterium]|nr:sulfatase-like hydrolase/transferase [Eubacteriales bacterium]
MKAKNLLMIVADDMGAWAMGTSPNLDVITPCLDRLADEGAYFENFYCASPVCSPARASILTGLMPSAHGVFDWLRSGNIDRSEIPESLVQEPLFADEDGSIDYLEGLECYSERLAEAGFDCRLSGKWHLGQSQAIGHGFRSDFCIARGGCYYMRPDVYRNRTLQFEDAYITDLISDDACKQIDELAQSDRPFYLAVHYTAPHTPWGEDQHPAEYWRLYENCTFDASPKMATHPWQVPSCEQPREPGPELRAKAAAGEAAGIEAVERFEADRRRLLRGYYTAITAMDAGIARILDRLDEHGLSDQTWICFVSDNGMNLGQHGLWGKGNASFPLNLYETSCKVPCIMRLPGVIPAALRVKDLHSHLDFFPSILECFELEAKIDTPLRAGRSLWPSLMNSQPSPSSIPAGEVCVVDEYGPNRMIRRGNFKLIRRYPYGPDELYDLAQDPEEQINLINDSNHSQVRHDLDVALHRWADEHLDPRRDGCREAVTGSGQLGLAAERATGPVYADRDLPLEYFERKT